MLSLEAREAVRIMYEIAEKVQSTIHESNSKAERYRLYEVYGDISDKISEFINWAEDHEKATGQLRVCKGCGTKFHMTSGEIGFYKGKNLQMPKYCPKCREIRKAERTTQKPIDITANEFYKVASGGEGLDFE